MRRYLATVEYPNGHSFLCEVEEAKSKQDAIEKIRNEYEDECRNPKITIIKTLKGNRNG